MICSGVFGNPLDETQKPAIFLRNGLRISTNSEEFTVIRETDVSISFALNKNEDGRFSCRTALNESSNVEQLAGMCNTR